ncbi:ABC1 kinase family protein [Solidesulfovibrio alcoholivorans]|uniref:ABC1 kinase family protein n=1 Tax=Solidesulfovibrio alcoholivorans TaxID=81406 RepID=UPI000498612E|nr:AarF/ABC1/UbiB kinase family protein [Solidesulfovibrio alcoholivorans]HCR11927.1 AarF/ABC1/UbiB kinase family protein [Desulfovibrio sp.]HML61479.1 AarF/ABC1/UbiB kinase family protein [Solidesulfovibrio sp.]
MFSLATIPHLARNARRFTEIAGVLAKYGLAEFLAATDTSFFRGTLKGPAGATLSGLTREARLRLAMTELGATAVKIGQILSTRPDLVGPETAAELAKLREDTAPDAPEVVRATIEAELGAPPEAHFSAFEETPVASASIGQVHRAILADGSRVVVKVQHAGIEEDVRADLDIAMGLAELAERGIVELRLYQPLAVAAEMRRTILRELDFTREERNLRHFAANFSGDARVVFPRTFPGQSARRVLTMEELDGESVAALAAAPATPEESARRTRLAKNAADIFLEMIFRDNFFHADPHPGNLLILPGDRLGLLDCGMVGRIDERTRRALEDALLAVASGDAEALTEQVMRLGRVPPGLDRQALAADVEEFVADYAGQSVGAFDLSGALGDMAALVRRHGILLPPTVAHLLKVFVVLEGASRQLHPGFSLIEVLTPYAAKILARRFSPGEVFSKLRRGARDWNALFETLPRDAAEILRRARDGRLDVRLDHKGLDGTVNRLVYGIVTAALFLGSCMLLASRVPPRVFDVSLFGALGCLWAIVLGLRLLRAIRRSGELGGRS